MFNQFKKWFLKLTAIELAPQERQAHEESERIRHEVERGRALESTRKAFEKELTPEDIERAQEKAREREEIKPYGE